MALFESYERRIDKINAVLNSYGIASIEEAEKITKDAGLDVYNQVKKIQPICFENACWAYTVGAAIAIKKGCRRAADAAAAIGEGLQAFCIPGSVAEQRKVGLGHGNLALCYRRSRSGRHRRRTSAENFPKARRFRLSRLFEPRAAFSQFQRSCSVRTQRCDSHRKQHGKGVLRCLGGIPEGAGITSKSCPYGSSFSWHLISQN